LEVTVNVFRGHKVSHKVCPVFLDDWIPEPWLILVEVEARDFRVLGPIVLVLVTAVPSLPTVRHAPGSDVVGRLDVALSNPTTRLAGSNGGQGRSVEAPDVRDAC
jgi:hypothetical protein